MKGKIIFSAVTVRVIWTTFVQDFMEIYWVVFKEWQTYAKMDLKIPKGAPNRRGNDVTNSVVTITVILRTSVQNIMRKFSMVPKT